MKRTEMKRSGPIKQKPVVRKDRTTEPRTQAPPRRSTLKTRQRAVKPEEKALWDRLANEIGCIACVKDGRFNDYVSIHHVHGRTAPDCHKKVLALCAGHHQDNGSGLIAVHPWKARFEARYGNQDDLIAESYKLIGLTYAP
jgi:hypothetical protein